MNDNDFWILLIGFLLLIGVVVAVLLVNTIETGEKKVFCESQGYSWDSWNLECYGVVGNNNLVVKEVSKVGGKYYFVND